MSLAMVSGFDFVFEEHDGWFRIKTIHDGIQYYANIRKQERSAFDDLKCGRWGVHGACFYKYSADRYGKMHLWYSADVGRSCSIYLYPAGAFSQKVYFTGVDYSYSHDEMIPCKWRQKC